MELMINICLSVWVFLAFALIIGKAGVEYPSWLETVLGGISIANLVFLFVLIEFWVWSR